MTERGRSRGSRRPTPDGVRDALPADAPDRTLAARVALALAPDIGPRLAERLVARFGDAVAVLEASESALREVEGIGPRAAASLRDPALPARAAAEIERARDLGVSLVHRDDPRYPPSLAAIPAPPPVLWVLGRIEEGDRLAVAIVGTRRPSEYGRTMARLLAGDLARAGLTVVSGLAMGIDAEAHVAAMDAGGRTIAVLGQGFDTPIQPSGNRRVAARIVEESRGAIVAPFPLGTSPSPGLFPQRNAIIAGLGLGTLVVEAGDRSGSLITASRTAELGRPAMACPGDATRLNARGSNRLIAEGASLVQCADDALAAMGRDLVEARNRFARSLVPGAASPLDDASSGAASPGRPTPSGPSPLDADPLAALLREELVRDRLHEDALLEHAASHGHEPARVRHLLFTLELEGRIRQFPGGLYEWIV